MEYKCKNCNSLKIKTRRNYPHGRKSKAIIIKTCSNCKSTNIEALKRNFGRRKY